MIALLNVLIEHRNPQLSRPFTYRYDGEDTIQRGVRVEIDFNHQRLIGFVLDVTWVNANDPRLSPTDYRVEPIQTILDQVPILTDELIELAQNISTIQPTPIIALLQTMVPKSLRPSKSGLKGPKIAYEQRYIIRDIPSIETVLTPNEYETYVHIKQSGSVKKGQLKPASVVKALVAKHAITLETIEKRRTKIGYLAPSKKPQLTRDQTTLIEQFLKENHSVVYFMVSLEAEKPKSI